MAAVRLPDVAVVMPILNEAAHLRRSVEAILAQEYGGALSVYLAVGPSSDGTEAVAASLAEAFPNVHVRENPSGRTPSALNVALGAGREPVVVRVDGHAELSQGYVSLAVSILMAPEHAGVGNVGGIQRAVGETPFECAVAAALASPFSMGGAKFHVGGAAGAVDTVYLGVFRREALDAVGGYDETLIRNQDYELNVRLRDAGWLVWFEPELWVSYRPRPTLRALARQYYEYGTWKRRVLIKHPRSLKLRQLAPLAALLGCVGGVVGGFWWPWTLAVPAAYVCAVAAASVHGGGGSGATARLAVVFPTMHMAWAAGFLGGRRRGVDTLFPLARSSRVR